MPSSTPATSRSSTRASQGPFAKWGIARPPARRGSGSKKPGVMAALAEEVRQAAVPLVARVYARSTAVRAVVDRFEASELLESRSFDAVSGRYVGRWLDLALLADDLRHRGVGASPAAHPLPRGDPGRGSRTMRPSTWRPPTSRRSVPRASAPSSAWICRARRSCRARCAASSRARARRRRRHPGGSRSSNGRESAPRGHRLQRSASRPSRMRSPRASRPHADRSPRRLCETSSRSSRAATLPECSSSSMASRSAAGERPRPSTCVHASRCSREVKSPAALPSGSPRSLHVDRKLPGAAAARRGASLGARGREAPRRGLRPRSAREHGGRRGPAHAGPAGARRAARHTAGAERQTAPRELAPSASAQRRADAAKP